MIKPHQSLSLPLDIKLPTYSDICSCHSLCLEYASLRLSSPDSAWTPPRPPLRAQLNVLERKFTTTL